MEDSDEIFLGEIYHELTMPQRCMFLFL